jgi:hypothetical protein
MVERSKMAPTATNSLVSAPSLGHHQAVIIQGSETIQKLIIINQEISHVTSRYIKNMCQECKLKTVPKNSTKNTKAPTHVKNNYFGKKNSFRNSYLNYQFE